MLPHEHFELKSLKCKSLYYQLNAIWPTYEQSTAMISASWKEV